MDWVLGVIMTLGCIYMILSPIITLVLYLKSDEYKHKKLVKKLLKDPNIPELLKTRIRIHELIENSPFVMK